MLKISGQILLLVLGVSVLFGCQRSANNEFAHSDVERFTHEAGTCPLLPVGTYFIAGVPENQRESITVLGDNQFGNKVALTVEGRSFLVLPTGKMDSKDYGVNTEDRIEFVGGCNGGAFVISYAGVAGGKKVKGRTSIRPSSGNSLSVSQNRSGQGLRNFDYRRVN